MAEVSERQLSPIELEQRSTRLDIEKCVTMLEGLKARFENPGLSEQQMQDVRTAIAKMFDSIKDSNI